MLWVFRPTSAVADYDLRLGFRRDPAATSGVTMDGMSLEKLAADTNYFVVARASGVETRTDTGVAFNATTWIKLRIRMISSTSVGFTLNGGTEIVISTNVVAVTGAAATRRRSQGAPTPAA